MSVNTPHVTDEMTEPRFAFGLNWLDYLSRVDDRLLQKAMESLRALLQVDHLDGLRFVDVGSGSGIFSLAARRLGAHVTSFDFDEHSVRCTERVKREHFKDDDSWTIRQGSVLDPQFIASLGTHDVVYSWGVLHHTGNMWQAMERVIGLVAPGGLLCVALYNDQGVVSRVWRVVKRAYNLLPETLRFLVLWPAFVRLWGPTLVADGVRGNMWHTWNLYGNERGMSPLVDVKDWVGGYPFEVATPEAVIAFYEARGFALRSVVRREGIGCNEFVFVRSR